MNVSLFNFNWSNVYGQPEASLYTWPTLRDEHEIFNQAFRQAFPKVLDNQPYSSYTDSVGLGVIAGSRLYAIGETVLSPDDTKYHVSQIAKASGFRGKDSDIIFSQKTIGELQDGQNLTDPGTTVNPFFTGDPRLCGALGIPCPGEIPWWVYAVGGIVLISLLRR